MTGDDDVRDVCLELLQQHAGLGVAIRRIRVAFLAAAAAARLAPVLLLQHVDPRLRSAREHHLNTGWDGLSKVALHSSKKTQMGHLHKSSTGFLAELACPHEPELEPMPADLPGIVTTLRLM